MKYLVLVVALAMSLVGPLARAGGFNLVWGTGCHPVPPTTLSTFACDSNDGSVSFTVSFEQRDPIHSFVGIEAWLDLQSDSPDLPDWWQLTDPGGCRQGALAVSFDASATPGGCADPWQDRELVLKYVNWSTAAFPHFGDMAADRAKLYVLYSIAANAVDLPGGVEYFAFTVTINFAKTVGAGACGGCSTPVTVVLNRVNVLGTSFVGITSPLNNQCLRWQAGGMTPCSATPTRSGTWGMLKSLYR